MGQLQQWTVEPHAQRFELQNIPDAATVKSVVLILQMGQDMARSRRTAERLEAKQQAKVQELTEGVIEASAIYPVAAFQKLAGVSPSWIKKAKADGLQILKVGQKRFIRGIDFEDFLLRQNQAEGLRRIENHGGYRPDVPGIMSDRLYPVQDLYKHAALNSMTIRQLKQNGMHTARVGKQYYVRGADLIEAILLQSEKNKEHAARLRDKYGLSMMD